MSKPPIEPEKISRSVLNEIYPEIVMADKPVAITRYKAVEGYWIPTSLMRANPDLLEKVKEACK